MTGQPEVGLPLVNLTKTPNPPIWDARDGHIGRCHAPTIQEAVRGFRDARDSEGYYVASVPQIPTCHTQAQSLDEVMLRVREAIQRVTVAA